MAVKKDLRSLEQAEPFKSLFPVDAETLKLVTASMREHGFQHDKPILVWKDAFGERGRQVVVDGHTRLRAAQDLKLAEVSVTVRAFKNTDEAITAGVGEQVQRRNLNREQIAAYVISILPLLDEVKGGLRTRTAKDLAKMLGVSVPTIDRARGILASGDEELIGHVKTGKLSILAAYDITTGRIQTGSRQPPPEAETDAGWRIVGGKRKPKATAEQAEPPEDDAVEPEQQIAEAEPVQAFADFRTFAWKWSRQTATLIAHIEQVRLDALDEDELAKDLGLGPSWMTDAVVEEFGSVLSDLDWLREEADRVGAAVAGRLGEQGLRNKIAALRARTVANGATKEEEAAAARAAERLERRLTMTLTHGGSDA